MGTPGPTLSTGQKRGDRLAQWERQQGSRRVITGQGAAPSRRWEGCPGDARQPARGARPRQQKEPEGGHFQAEMGGRGRGGAGPGPRTSDTPVMRFPSV